MSEPELLDARSLSAIRMSVRLAEHILERQPCCRPWKLPQKPVNYRKYSILQLGTRDRCKSSKAATLEDSQAKRRRLGWGVYLTKVTSGSLFSKAFDPEADIGNLSGKVIVVTGGNSGIGYATIQHLARRGAKVYMAARSEPKVREAIAKLKEEGLGPGNGEVLWHRLDLSDPRKAKKAAEEFMEKETRLNVLVNNAAVLLVPYAVSHDGIQDVMMINHVSPFVFTTTLLPLLKATAKEPKSDVRIVNVSSDAVRMAGNGLRYRNREDFNDDHSKSWYAMFDRYARSKQANVLFTKELQRRMDEEGVPIIALSLHPGTVDTKGLRAPGKQKGVFYRAFYKLMSKTLFLSPEDGALNSVFAAAAPTVRANADKYKGVYLRSTGVISTPNKDALRVELAQELWGTTEAILKEIGIDV